jgi:hypothetical protein
MTNKLKTIEQIRKQFFDEMFFYLKQNNFDLYKEVKILCLLDEIKDKIDHLQNVVNNNKLNY